MFRVVIAGGGMAGLEAMLALRDLAGDRGADLVRARVTAVEPRERRVALEHGDRLAYDALLVSVGFIVPPVVAWSLPVYELALAATPDGHPVELDLAH